MLEITTGNRINQEVCSYEITKDILYVGVNDHLVDLFESQYDVPNGMAYNSYLICDERSPSWTASMPILPTSGSPRSPLHWASARPTILSCSTWSLTISGSVAAFAQAYPETTIVASAQAFNMMKAYFGTDYADRRIVVKGRGHPCRWAATPCILSLPRWSTGPRSS